MSNFFDPDKSVTRLHDPEYNYDFVLVTVEWTFKFFSSRRDVVSLTRQTI